MKTAAAFKVEKREQTGTGAARAIRRDGKVPAILYSKGSEPVYFSVPERDLELTYKKGGFFSKIVSFNLDGKELFALPKEVQQHPVTDRIEHADFLKVDEKSKIPVRVPVKFKNADRSIGIKRGGVLNVVRHDVTLICSPNAIPESIEIDLLEVNIGQSIHISAVKLPEGVTPEITNRDFTIATIAGRSSKMDEEEAPKAEAAAEGAAAAGAAAPAAGKDAAKPAGKKE